MKKLIILLIALFAMNGAMAQWPSSCDATEELESYYQDDVKDIAAQWLFDIHSPDTALIDIPQWSQDTVWSGLAAISNCYALPEVDSVFNKYCIHRLMGFINIRTIWVQLDPACSWLNNWMNLQIATGVADLDTLLSDYNFTLNYFFANDHWGVLSTTEMINLYALCDSLGSFEGIANAEPDGWGGSAAWYDHIYFSDTAGIKYYIFQLGVGLAERYRWNFRVDTECSVEFLGNGGSYCFELPEPINCNIFTNINENRKVSGCTIFPNPSNDKITISHPALTGISNLSIYSVSGEKVMEKQFSNNETQLNIGALPRGVYFVRVQDEKGIEVGKIIKQ